MTGAIVLRRTGLHSLRKNRSVSELVKSSAAWIARAVRAKEVSVVEVVDAHAARIDQRNPDVNAIVLPRLEQARAEAVAADAAVARGDVLGPLHGVPFTAKEVIPVANHVRVELDTAEAHRRRMQRRLGKTGARPARDRLGGNAEHGLRDQQVVG